MKKVLLILGGIVLFTIALIAFLLFTGTGNNIIKPLVETYINKYSPLPITVEKFRLKPSNISLEFKTKESFRGELNSDFYIFKKQLSGNIFLHIFNLNDLAIFNKDIKQFNTEKFKVVMGFAGSIDQLNIHAISDIAHSDISLDGLIVNYRPKEIKAIVKELKIENLLKLAGYKEYAKGIINANADIQINDDEYLNSKGNLILKVNSGSVNENLVKKDFKVIIPKTNFNINLQALFDKDIINHNVDIISNVGKIILNGNTKLGTLKTDTKYNIAIDNLTPLTPLISRPIYGSFYTTGRVSGTTKSLSVAGDTNVANSTTSYALNLVNLAPNSLILNIKNMKMDEILYMLGMPKYTNAKLNAEAKLDNISTNIKGSYKHNTEGILFKETILKEFNIDTLENLPIKQNANINIENNQAIFNSKTSIKSMEIIFKNATFNMKTNDFQSPYEININNLKDIMFLSKKELKGKFNGDGIIKFNKSGLEANLHSDIFNGKLDATLINNVFNAKFNLLNTTKILEMLMYPDFFASNIDGSLTYNLINKTGNFDAKAKEGKLQGQLVDLAKSAGMDLNKEIYEHIIIKGDIKDKLIIADFNMNNKNSSIDVKRANIDFEKDNLLAAINIKHKTYILDFHAKGPISKPKISLDERSIIKNLKENENIKKEIKKLENKAKDLLKGLF